jgi:hypothetical protein
MSKLLTSAILTTAILGMYDTYPHRRMQVIEPDPPPDPRIAAEKLAAAQAKRDRKNAKRKASL